MFACIMLGTLHVLADVILTVFHIGGEMEVQRGSGLVFVSELINDETKI